MSQAKQKISNRFVVMHSTGIKDEVDRKFWLESEREGFPSFANWCFRTEKDKAERISDLFIDGCLWAGLDGLFDDSFNIILRYFFSWPLEDGLRKFNKLTNEIPLPKKDKILNSPQSLFNRLFNFLLLQDYLTFQSHFFQHWLKFLTKLHVFYW